MPVQPLSAAEVRTGLDALPSAAPGAWRHEDGRLRRSLRFPTFVEAFGFLSRVALLAERADHHPHLENEHRNVEIALSTHEAKAVTQKDLDLARGIEDLLRAAAPTAPKARPGS